MAEETQPAAVLAREPLHPLEAEPAASDEPETAPPMRRSLRSRLQKNRFLRWGLYLLAFLVAWPIVGTIIYTVVPPPITNIMILRTLSGNGIDKHWVSLDDMSPWLARAVISSEDARFCDHNGVDWIELQGIIDDAMDDGEAPTRGASTIPMQTAKNLFLWDGRLAIRKVIEIPLAMWIDLIWSKRRIIEVYLNIVEWAPGVYGAEAAAQHHFHKPAKNLTKKEAALLAAVLPNPIKRNAGKPSRGVRAVASRILVRMAGMGAYLTCLEP
ncbi:monofunctional biosynthetic peptidoglycan transglycosylase [Aestuariivirga sp.]|uniref:monofunctional biosynthetic peptidoglycan transglycosylase n=1 Tax=Aestuariivirga sp. TaxID=2650926 RepID=UPI0025B7E982|nr:monofunctional biosynthetic peptidoglycan transglycosylase [Aestuariivirga sp.]